MKQYKLPTVLTEWEHVSVTWEDILTHEGPVKSEGFRTSITPCIRRTTGYVLVYNDSYLVVATTDDRGSQQDTDCEDATQIPLGNIRRIIKK